MTVRAREGLPLLILAIVLAGCGGGGRDEPSTVNVTAQPSSTTASSFTRPTRSPAQEAEAVVRRYYRAINHGAYSTAWAQLAPALQAELGGFATWMDGYGTTVSTHAYGVQTVETSRTSVVVELEIESTDIDECSTTVGQSFSGTWSLTAEGDRFRGTSFDVQKLSGGTPVLNPSECSYEEPAETYVPTESEGSGCDPNYTGCVPESFGDVDCDEVGEEVEVIGEDVYGLDLEEDGYACEIY